MYRMWINLVTCTLYVRFADQGELVAKSEHRRRKAASNAIAAGCYADVAPNVVAVGGWPVGAPLCARALGGRFRPDAYDLPADRLVILFREGIIGQLREKRGT